MSIFDLFKQIESEKPKISGSAEYLVVGLGNPGDKYKNTRHNAGFLAIDKLAEKLNVKINKLKYKATMCEAVISGKKVLLLKPQTFMNLSGESVSEAADFYKIPPEKIIVLCDDVSLETAKVRTRAKGSHGGQNGLRNIITLLGTDNFIRIKIGVGGKPHPDYDLADWVLSAFTTEDAEKMDKAFDVAISTVEEIIKTNVQTAMNKNNKTQ